MGTNETKQKNIDVAHKDVTRRSNKTKSNNKEKQINYVTKDTGLKGTTCTKDVSSPSEKDSTTISNSLQSATDVTEQEYSFWYNNTFEKQRSANTRNKYIVDSKIDTKSYCRKPCAQSSLYMCPFLCSRFHAEQKHEHKSIVEYQETNQDLSCVIKVNADYTNHKRISVNSNIIMETYHQKGENHTMKKNTNKRTLTTKYNACNGRYLRCKKEEMVRGRAPIVDPKMAVYMGIIPIDRNVESFKYRIGTKPKLKHIKTEAISHISDNLDANEINAAAVLVKLSNDAKQEYIRNIMRHNLTKYK